MSFLIPPTNFTLRHMILLIFHFLQRRHPIELLSLHTLLIITMHPRHIPMHRIHMRCKSSWHVISILLQVFILSRHHYFRLHYALLVVVVDVLGGEHTLGLVLLTCAILLEFDYFAVA